MIRPDTFTKAVLREVLSMFLLALVLCTGVLLFEKLFRIMKMARGVPGAELLRLILYIQPSFLMLGIPMSLLVSVLIVYGRMNMDHEITVMMSSGAPFSRVARPALVFGALGTVVALGVSLYLFPLSNRLFRETLFRALRSSVRIEAGRFNTRFPGITLYAAGAGAGGGYRELFVYNEREPGRPLVVTAAAGRLFLDPEAGRFQFLFEDGAIHLPPRDDRYTLLEFGRYFMEVGASGGSVKRLHREAMFVPELLERARSPDDPGAIRYRIELHRRFALPAVCVILGLIAAPLAIVAGRGGRLAGFGMALAVMAGYYALLVLGENLARSGSLPAGPAVWLPNGVLLAVGLGLRCRRRRL